MRPIPPIPPRPRSSRKPPPGDGVSPELLELVVRWLRKKYGDRPVSGMLLHRLVWQMGDLERDFTKEPESTAVTRANA